MRGFVKLSMATLVAGALLGPAGATMPPDVQDGVEFTTGTGGPVIAKFLKDPRHFEVAMMWRGKQVTAVGLELGRDGLYVGFGEPSTECQIELNKDHAKVGAQVAVLCIEAGGHSYIDDHWTIVSIREKGVDVQAPK